MIKLGAHEAWTKASYSQGNGACVEVRSTEPTALEVTDSKFAERKTSVRLSPAAFSALVNLAAADVRV